jgi:hypothetical protein
VTGSPAPTNGRMFAACVGEPGAQRVQQPRLDQPAGQDHNDSGCRAVGSPGGISRRDDGDRVRPLRHRLREYRFSAMSTLPCWRFEIFSLKSSWRTKFRGVGSQITCHLPTSCSLGNFHVLCTVASGSLLRSCTTPSLGLMCTMPTRPAGLPSIWRRAL